MTDETEALLALLRDVERVFMSGERHSKAEWMRVRTAVTKALSGGSDATKDRLGEAPPSLHQDLSQPGIDAGFKSPPREGWATVPIEPTEEMVKAASGYGIGIRATYAAMIAAAPCKPDRGWSDSQPGDPP